MFYLKFRIKLILFILILFISNISNGQGLNFMMRLSGGEVESNNFKEIIPFELFDNRILVNAKINDSEREYKFILDTYSPCLISDSLATSLDLDILDLSKELGKQFEHTMMKPKFPLYKSISLGNLRFKNIGAIMMSDNSNNPFLDVIESGIIGANLLKLCILQINFLNKNLILTDQLEKLNNIQDAITIPFKPQSFQKSPNIQILLNGTDTLEIQFDTGSSKFLSFSDPSLDKLIDSGECIALHQKRKNAFGSIIDTAYFTKIKSLKLGSKIYYDLPVQVVKTERGAKGAKGSMGIKFLNNFIVTIDWINNNIYLSPIKDRDIKHSIKTFGFSYGYENDTMRVTSIYSSSDAEKT